MSRADVLVGHTGLVGGNLLEQGSFDLLINSKNADDLRGGEFGHVVFSAARAEKWRANGDPDADRAHVDQLIDLLGSFQADRLTLVSTVDVYGAPFAVDEESEVVIDGLHAYGANRRRLEQAGQELHRRALVVRLPALFGPGLKKNVIYDLMHGNEVHKIQPASSFQYYDLGRLTGDLGVLWGAGVRLCNLVTEPISTRRILEEAFGRDLVDDSATPVVSYDVRTRFAGLFGADGSYLERQPAVLERLSAFVRGRQTA